MKYKGIICFVYQKEKEEITQSIKDNHIIFSENFDDSKESIIKNIVEIVANN